MLRIKPNQKTDLIVRGISSLNNNNSLYDSSVAQGPQILGWAPKILEKMSIPLNVNFYFLPMWAPESKLLVCIPGYLSFGLNLDLFPLCKSLSLQSLSAHPPPSSPDSFPSKVEEYLVFH